MAASDAIMAASDAMPKTIGVIGVGTMTSAIVRGLCSAALSPAPKFVLAPRNAEKAGSLAKEYPDNVRIADNNQEVVDSSDCVIIGVLTKQAEEVLKSLSFREGQQVLSVMAGIYLDRISSLVAPACDCAIAIPLPAVAKHQGATITMPNKPFAEAIFSALGTYVPVEEEAQFKRLMCISCVMGDFYKRQLTAQEWLVSNGLNEGVAASWVGAIYKVFASDSADAVPDTFAKLVHEQTPGGLNEMNWKNLDTDGAYQALSDSLDATHHRLSTGSADPDLAPAAKRAKREGSRL